MLNPEILPGISLCTFVKNEAHCLEHMLASVSGKVINELIIVDTGSTDNTVKIARKYTPRVYQIGFSDFGSIRTITAHLARREWILMLDADETIANPHLLKNLIKKPTSLAYALPRKRWLDLEMTQQTEIEAYPDYQVRLFLNRPDLVWKRELHEYFHGCSVENIDNGIVLNHFQDVFKDKEANETRSKLYDKLAAKANVTVHGGKEIE